jgi:hypothetical protein
MNWDAIGAISDAVGAAAVIITLAYLAIQIRQNTQMNASALRARQMLHGTDSAQFSELLAKSTMTNEPLSPGEKLQMLRLFQAVFVGYQGAYFQHKQGAIGQDDWNTCRALLRSFGSSSRPADSWTMILWPSANCYERMRSVLLTNCKQRTLGLEADKLSYKYRALSLIDWLMLAVSGCRFRPE